MVLQKQIIQDCKNQVIQNEKQIAVMGAQQEAIAEDVIEVKLMLKDLQKMLNDWRAEQ